MGMDVHRLTAAQFYGIKPEEVTKEQRRQGKALNFRHYQQGVATGFKEILAQEIAKQEAESK